jgi:RNA polymerase-interacting CarD/CdnL/TRCF family regulator
MRQALENAKMINIKFEFDERKFRREVEKAAQEGVNEVAKDLTRDIDRLRLQYRGRPVDTIKPALKRLFERRGGKITEPELNQYAEMVRDGTRIEFKPERLRF